MKFKSDIEVQAGLKDSSGSAGTSGQMLISTATGVSWSSQGGYVPYTGATGNVNLGNYSLSAYNLIINHSSGSGVAASITKGGSGEALTVVKTSGSGNAASITGGVTLISELNLTTDLADAYIASAAIWNAKIGGTGTTNYVPKFTGASAIGNSLIYDNGTNVGIGTTSPGQKLTLINGTFQIGGASTFSDNVEIGRVGGDNNMAFATGGSERMRITSGGKVGINISPSSMLEIKDPSSTNSIQLGHIAAGGGYNMVSLNGTNAEGQYIGIAGGGGTDKNIYYQSGNAGSHQFRTGDGTNYVERMRIFSNGNTFIGSSPTDAGYKLDVNGSIRSNNATTSAGLNSPAFIGAGEFMSTGPSSGYFWENRSGGVTSNSNWYGWYTASGNIHLWNGSSNLLGITGTTGAATFSSLSGSGTRFVTADASGTLSTTTGGPISGSGSAGQVTFWNGANSITGESALFWDSTNDRLGIGTTSPSAKLQVGEEMNAATTGISIAAGTGGANLLGRTAASHHNWLPYTNGNNYYSASAHILRNQDHSVDWMTIHATGNITINTGTDAGYKLDVNGTGRYTGALTTSSVTTTISAQANAILGTVSSSWGGTLYPTLYGSATDRWVMHINPHVSYTQPGANGFTGSMTGSTIRMASDSAANSYWDIGVGTNSVGTDKFSIGRVGASFLAVNNSGNVGIGTASPDNHKLQITASAAKIYLQSSVDGSALDFGSYGISSAYPQTRLSMLDDGVWGGHMIFSTKPAGASTNALAERMRITSGGNVLIGTTTDAGVKLNVNGDFLASGFSKSYNGNVNSDNYFEKLYQNFPNFPNGVANQAADIRFGNLSFWGYIEIEITGTYSNQSTSGKLTKVFSVGTNPGNLIYVNESRVVDAIGTIVDNIAIGDFSWDATNSVYRIPISHIVSTGNPYTVKVRMFTHSAGAWAAFNGITLGGNYTLAALPRQYPYYNNRLGIGTSTPTDPLDVRGNVRVSGNGVNDGGLIGFGNYLNGAGYYDNAIYRSAFNSPTTAGNILHISSYEALVFTTQAAQIGTQAIRMYINGANGNVIIGGVTDNGQKFQVNGSSRFVGNANIQGITSIGQNTNGTAVIDAYGSLAYYGCNTASNGMGIGPTGAATFSSTVTATGFFNSSDIRLKEIVDYDYSVSDIKPISYLWKDSRDNKKHVGYSAQEVQKAMPDAVNEDTNGMLSVNYVEILVAKVAELENRIKQLEK